MKVAGIGRDGRKWGCENYESSLLIPVFCCMAFAVEYWYTARTIEDPTEFPWDVSIAPESGDFYARWYRCMLAIMPNPTKIHRIAYLAQNPDACLYCFL